MANTSVAQAPTFDQAAVPLILGVTGPREIAADCEAAIQGEIVALCRALRAEFPNTPLVVLSPLVPGADQLAAEAAVEAGERFAVVLPWPDFDCNSDTMRCGALDRFEQLRSKASYTIEMPWAETDDGRKIDAARIAAEPEARDKQYDEVGRYIARHAQILIAVWDQIDRSDSQTQRMVRWHSEGTEAPFSARQGALDATRPSAIYFVSPTIHAGRPERVAGASLERIDIRYPPLSPPTKVKKEEPPYVAEPQSFRDRAWSFTTNLLTRIFVGVNRCFPWVFGRRHTAKDGKSILQVRWRAIDDFNGDARKAAEYVAELKKSRGYLLPAAEAAKLGPCVERLLDAYARADVSALDYQRRSQRVVRRLFFVAALAVAAHETYAHGWHAWYVLAAYPLLLLGGYVWFHRSQRRNYQGRWLDLRALAETLRVQTFWCIAGRPECTADYYLRHFRGELDWIRHAARALFLTSGGHAPAGNLTPAERFERLRTARNNWVVDQLNYFVKKTPLHHRLETAFETAAKSAFLAAMVLSVIHVFLHLATHHMSHGLVLATFACLVTAAFLEEFADLQTYALTARKFEWMADLFAVAEQKLTKALTADGNSGNAITDAERLRQADEVVFELGREALAENADWVVQHRHRPPELLGG